MFHLKRQSRRYVSIEHIHWRQEHRCSASTRGAPARGYCTVKCCLLSSPKRQLRQVRPVCKFRGIPSRSMTWAEFIRVHLALLAGTDFFTVLTRRGPVTYYVLFWKAVVELTDSCVGMAPLRFLPRTACRSAATTSRSSEISHAASRADPAPTSKARDGQPQSLWTAILRLTAKANGSSNRLCKRAASVRNLTIRRRTANRIRSLRLRRHRERNATGRQSALKVLQRALR